MEQDCPPYLTTYRGIDEGSPRLLDLLGREKISATFFSTGDVAERFPSTISRIVAQGHELGCHGHTHRRFDRMGLNEAREEITQASQALRRFYSVTSFRAPNLQFPGDYLPLLEQEGYKIDSSEGKHKLPYYVRRKVATSLKRIPVSTTSSVLRLPDPLRRAIFSRLKSPVVLFVHPWEFVDLTKTRLRRDCRFKTGETALQCLQETVAYFRGRGARFRKMEELGL